MINNYWIRLKESNPKLAQFVVFYLLSKAITVLQLLLMPLIKMGFAHSSLVETPFRFIPLGLNMDGSAYYVFDYSSGSLLKGGGGGLAYFLAVQITLGIAQIINFFVQRSITFKSNSSIWRAAFWYTIAYVIISFGAAALQGFYKAPIYNLFMNTWELGSVGEAIADFTTMSINAVISFWVFYPIFRILFKQEPERSC
jgi:putative flippase GtrA